MHGWGEAHRALQTAMLHIADVDRNVVFTYQIFRQKFSVEITKLCDRTRMQNCF